MSDREPVSLRARLSERLRVLANHHRNRGRPDVFLFTTPRSGSTWLMELVCSQPGFKPCNEPLDLRREVVRRTLGIAAWKDLYDEASFSRVQRYFEGLCSGRIGVLNPSPREHTWRPFTSRIVAKILHGCEDRIPWFRHQLGGRIVLLVRHPVPVTLSREVYPRLEAFLESDYRRHFSAEQLRVARHLVREGSERERGVLDWCLQNALPLRQAEPDWMLVSYEQLVLDPRPVVERLAGALDLPRPDRLLAGLDRPSHTVKKSDADTARVLQGPDGRRRRQWLVERWRERVGRDEEARLMEILEIFGVDAYRRGDSLPADFIWHGDRPAPAERG